MGYDDLTTPTGRRREIPGGSALYFSLAAIRLCEVRVVAAVGSDGQFLLQLLDAAALDRSAVVDLPGPTYRWRAEHHPTDAQPVQEEQQLGVYLEWRPELPTIARESEILFLGSMHPQRQLEVLAQCPRAQLVGLDTMRDFVASHRRELEQLLQRTDVLFANEAELRALVPTSRPDPIEVAREALSRWSLQTVILKLGPRGAVAVSRDAAREYPAVAGPPPVDPTGAGDALAGGLLGRMAQLRRSDAAAVDLAMEAGGMAARAAISAFGVQGLLSKVR
ncbi:MAG TPA: PfkB family carbohydrate kinase [Candidatus Dormibacteraeota bacterium]|nr:PfkB family carbohydrate kinase [Candidatus Dormibacteraeota bacterium]